MIGSYSHKGTIVVTRLMDMVFHNNPKGMRIKRDMSFKIKLSVDCMIQCYNRFSPPSPTQNSP